MANNLTLEEIARLRELLTDVTPERLAGLRTVGEHAELLVDMGRRGRERRANQGKAKVSNPKAHNWTHEQARLNGLLSSMTSVMRAHRNSEKALKNAQAEFERTKGEVLMVRAKLDEFHAEMKEQNRVVTLLDDSSVVDVASLAP